MLKAAVIAIAAVSASGDSSGQDASAGWTGVTDPQAVISARQALMTDMERHMRAIDSYTAGEPVDAESLRASAASIAPLLIATPHLFPPTTDLYEEAAEVPVTVALPAVWENFAAFTSMAANAASAAESLSAASEPEQLQTGAAGLRAACDACHALYLLPYEPPSVTSEDLNFDFDALFSEFEDSEASEP